MLASCRRLLRWGVHRFVNRPADEDSGADWTCEMPLRPRKQAKGKRLYFVLGVGRSGMRWTASVLGMHKGCQSFSEPFPFEEAFHRYCRWYDIPVDPCYVACRYQQLIRLAHRQHDTLFVATPYMGVDIDFLDAWLAPDGYLFCLRPPEAVVRSLVHKGWYGNPVISSDAHRVPGLQRVEGSGKHPHRQFSRILPPPPLNENWLSMTSVGKCAWYWAAYNRHIWTQLSELAPERVSVLRLEAFDQNYGCYCNAVAAYGVAPEMPKETFLGLKDTMPNKSVANRQTADWSPIEREEFDVQTEAFIREWKTLQVTLLGKPVLLPNAFLLE